jgi:hypothetical protein
MPVIDLLLLIFSFLSFTLASPTRLRTRGPSTFVFPGDAPYTVDTATLAAALTCPNGNPTKASPPVLLVHGTGSTGEQSWGDGYVPVCHFQGASEAIVPFLYAARIWRLQISLLHEANGLY